MKECPVCKGEVKGRRDKVFCSAVCKSTYHYEEKVENEAFYFEVDKQLKVNRKLLKKYNVEGYTTVRKSDLEKEGFNSHYFTHYWKNKEGKVYLFVYDHGFLEIEQKGVTKFVLGKWQEYMQK